MSVPGLLPAKDCFVVVEGPARRQWLHCEASGEVLELDFDGNVQWSLECDPSGMPWLSLDDDECMIFDNLSYVPYRRLGSEQTWFYCLRSAQLLSDSQFAHRSTQGTVSIRLFGAVLSFSRCSVFDRYPPRALALCVIVLIN